MELIPDLPNDVARECLLRLSYTQFSMIASTCKGWKVETQSPAFFQLRKATAHAQKLFVMAQVRVDPERRHGLVKLSPRYGLTLLELDTGNWVDLPPVPGCSDGLPFFCQLAEIGSDLVVMGGLDPVTWEASSSVFVYSFLSAKWRRGADMPGVRRSLFGCASDGDRTVYVAGGHDSEKNALRSALAYDVAKDEWTHMPDMARERDECKAIFHRGKFHIISGYTSDMQGSFQTSSETFDNATWQWDQVHEDFLKPNPSSKNCLCGHDKIAYMIHEGHVLAREGMTWQVVAKLPADVSNAGYMTAWQGKLLVIGSPRFGEPHSAYVLNLKTSQWTQIETPEKYSGHVQGGCYLEI